MTYCPRGVSKEKMDLWFKELGTEKNLIKRWKSGKVRWNEFKKEYNKRLISMGDLLEDLAYLSRKVDIILLCTDKDVVHCRRILLAYEV